MPSSDRSSLGLVLPGFAPKFATQNTRLAALERLVAYSDDGLVATSTVPTLEDWQSELLFALGLSDATTFASAPLTWLGLGGELHEGTWLHADPVRFEMSGDGMTLHSMEAWPDTQRENLEQRLAEHFAGESVSWRSLAGRDFVFSRATLSAQTVCPRFAAQHALREVLPQGDAAPQLRRVMTELQMLLHERFTGAAPNAVWLWGNGQIGTPMRRDLQQLWTNDAYARGLYRAHAADARCSDAPSSLEAIIEHSNEGPILAVVREDSLEVLERDWLDPARRALDRGRFDCVELYLDGRRVTARRSLLKRWFARPHSLAPTSRGAHG